MPTKGVVLLLLATALQFSEAQTTSGPASPNATSTPVRPATTPDRVRKKQTNQQPTEAEKQAQEDKLQLQSTQSELAQTQMQVILANEQVALALKLLAQTISLQKTDKTQEPVQSEQDEAKSIQNLAQEYLECTNFKSQDVTNSTSTALACEWLRPSAAPAMLSGMRNYTAKKQNLDADIQNIKNSAPEYGSLYLAAVKAPNNQERTERERVFLEEVSKANLRNPQKMDSDETNALFASAKKIMDVIFSENNGKSTLVEINDLFKEDHLQQYRAFYILLQSAFSSSHSANILQDLYKLETLRAAYQTDPNRLISLVATEISAPQAKL